MLLLSILLKANHICHAQTPISTININPYVEASPSDDSGSIRTNTASIINFIQVQNLIPTAYVAGRITYDCFVTPNTLIIRSTNAGNGLITKPHRYASEAILKAFQNMRNIPKMRENLSHMDLIMNIKTSLLCQIRLSERLA